MASEHPETGERRLGRVQHPHLQALEWSHVVDEARAGEIPARRAASEAVLDHPLPERLAADRGAVAIAVVALERREVGWRRRRHDAVDHGRGEGGVAADPVGEPAAAPLGEQPHHALEDAAVAGDVVAADQGQRLPVRQPPPLEGLRQQAGQAAWRLGSREVVGDVRILVVERPARRAMAVALFGHRDRDHVDRGVGERRERGPGRALAVDDPAQAADHAGVGAVAGAEHPGVESVLRSEALRQRRHADIDSDHAPAVEAGLEHVVCELGLVAAVERTDPEMRHPDPERGAVVARPPDAGREAVERPRPEQLGWADGLWVSRGLRQGCAPPVAPPARRAPRTRSRRRPSPARPGCRGRRCAARDAPRSPAEAPPSCR